MNENKPLTKKDVSLLSFPADIQTMEEVEKELDGIALQVNRKNYTVELDTVHSAVEGLNNAQLIGGDSICYRCKKHREGGVYDKQLVYCLQCWADKWFPIFAEKKEGAE